jgi:hypothetical protein
LRAALAATILTVLTTACATTTKIEYVREIPVVAFPMFPPPDCVIYDEATDTVSMPLWYWRQVAEYKIDVDAARDYLTILRGRAASDGMKALAEKARKKTDRLLEGKR